MYVLFSFVFEDCASLRPPALILSATALIWPGVVPQQPPKSVMPCAKFLSWLSENSSGSTLKTSFPFTTTGRPALGWARTGRCAYEQNCSASFSSSSRLPPQLKPKTSTWRDSRYVTQVRTSAPVRVLRFD